MPSLRFVRDKRGYENTFVVHSDDRLAKGAGQRILYWFRTPPGVKVGRAALDEEAIRTIEAGHPDIAFDWEQMLKVRTGSVAPRRAEALRKQRRPAGPRRRSPGQHLPATSAPQGAEETPENHAPLPDEPSSSPVEIRALGAPVAARIGPEDLTRLLARHAELLARIERQVPDLERREVLRLEAEGINPDTWVTAGETTQGLTELDRRYESLTKKIGGRRRRSRRGGRRRKSRTVSPAPANPEDRSDV